MEHGQPDVANLRASGCHGVKEPPGPRHMRQGVAVELRQSAAVKKMQTAEGYRENRYPDGNGRSDRKDWIGLKRCGIGVRPVRHQIGSVAQIRACALRFPGLSAPGGV